MGQYIQAGICCRVKVSKKEMERNKVSYENVVEGLAKEINIGLYEIFEVESGYIFSLKDEVLENGQLDEFLTEQYRLFNADKDRIEEIISKLKGLNNADSIVEFAEKKKYENFQYISVYDNIYCGKWEKGVMVEYELILFFLAGKIIMESYRIFLRYIESLIKKDNPYKVSETVKVFIG